MLHFVQNFVLPPFQCISVLSHCFPPSRLSRISKSVRWLRVDGKLFLKKQPSLGSYEGLGWSFICRLKQKTWEIFVSMIVDLCISNSVFWSCGLKVLGCFACSAESVSHSAYRLQLLLLIGGVERYRGDGVLYVMRASLLPGEMVWVFGEGREIRQECCLFSTLLTHLLCIHRRQTVAHFPCLVEVLRKQASIMAAWSMEEPMRSAEFPFFLSSVFWTSVADPCRRTGISLSENDV